MAEGWVPPLLARYREEAVPALMEQFAYRNPLEVPRLKKVVINVGLGEALENAKSLDSASRDMAIVTGQRPVVTRAKSSIAGFKLREGNPIGIKATLRGERMYGFLDRLINVALPRHRDFRGVSPDAFDGRGGYSLGLTEQLAFAEIDYDSVDRARGLGITVVTTARTEEEARELLRLLGMPFARR